MRSEIQQLLLMFYILKKIGPEICSAYISKTNSNCEKQIILIMIPNAEKKDWHYLALKDLYTLLKGITSKHHGDFYRLNCLYSFRTENKLNLMKNYVKTKISVE